ncbi:hypothetical protein [Flectobacillus longus]|uniref:hypothetical protein n=1 Tax=Flectobacillus longus TaxID=2984207 RepID=UPI0024B6975C|nr:hypothetical protein [Flectobacillus longus]MDI9882742.1 hypothetical protein [Flectobacillus longus]
MEKENPALKFKIQGIKTEQFATFDHAFSPSESTELETELQFKIDSSNKLIGVFLGVEFIQNQQVFLKIVVSCHFKIEGTTWETFQKKEEKILTIPRSFTAHLAMITTGTTRGILFNKTETTIYSSYIIPTLNVDEMIPEDITFSIQ